jgi:two-component system sensor histidine kinase EvgS
MNRRQPMAGKQMAKPLQVLMVEDSENDALLLLRELKRSGYAPAYERVFTAASLNAALAKQSWDIIISDFVMPQFSGLEALKMIRGKGFDVPIIIMSGKISDETAVMAMKAGASDYIMKDNLARLGPAIERELYESALRVESEKASAAFREREDELRSLKKVNQLKDEFIGLVSHELRTPLTVILGALSIVMTEEDKLSRREVKQLIGDAYSEAENLSEILANLLELARAQANRLQINEEPVNIKETIDTVLKKMQPQTVFHRLNINCDDSITVNADRVRLQRILHNLLDNAMKYSAPGTEIKLFVRQDQNDILIGIKDKGIGISPEQLGKLFEPFQRLEPQNNKATGTGLGLVVCRRLVEAHKGRMWVESQPGEGSTFDFTLPMTDIGSYRTA